MNQPKISATRLIIAQQICALAYASVLPKELVAASVQVDHTAKVLRIKKRSYNLGWFENIFVVGGGKATVEMLKELINILNDRITDGVVNVSGGEQAQQAERSAQIINTRDEGAVPVYRLGKVLVIPASHANPNEAGVEGVHRMIDLLRKSGERDLVIVLVSGGGSDLMACPVEGITLAEYRETSRLLKSVKADIGEVNAVRKHLDSVKGGKMRLLAKRAGRVVTLALSDVPVVSSQGRLQTDPPDVIASGPTVGDHSTYEDAYAVLQKYDLTNKVPKAVVDYLRAGKDGVKDVEIGGRSVNVLPENPTTNHEIFSDDRTQFAMIGNNDVALNAAARAASQAGYRVVKVAGKIHKEVNETAKDLVDEIKTYVKSRQRVAIIWGGEPTVQITTDKPGIGGRNRHLALLVATMLEEANLDNVVFVSFGTDGADGSPDAAGAIVDAQIVRSAGISKARDALLRFDSGSFLKEIGVQIEIPKKTNVADVAFALID
jgi:glycerate 2-kinase